MTLQDSQIGQQPFICVHPAIFWLDFVKKKFQKFRLFSGDNQLCSAVGVANVASELSIKHTQSAPPWDNNKTFQMAKNTSSSAFRKIDVDAYNEDNFKDDDTVQEKLGPDENQVTNLLNQGKTAEALQFVLQNAPLGCKDQQVKDQALNLTLRVLLAIKATQMDSAIDQIGPELLDVLMKYIYRGFEIPSEGSSGHLLTWHEKAFARGGLGSIARVLADTARA